MDGHPLGTTVLAFDGTVGQIASVPFQDGGRRQMVACAEGLVGFLVRDLRAHDGD